MKKISKAKWILAAWLLYAVLAQGGCSRATGCPDGKVCLRYMAWGNPEQLAVERQMVNEFNRKNPDLHVKLFTVPGSSYELKLTTMLVSGTAPDVLRIDHYYFPAFQKKGYFYDLTPFASKDRSFRISDFVPSAIAEGTVNGKLYGLNALFGGVILYYNKTLYRAVHLEDPYELSKQGRWTWDRFRHDAIRLTRFTNGRPAVFGTDIPPFPLSAPIIWSFGGDLLTTDMAHSLIGSPEAAKGYQFLFDLVWKDKAAPTPSQGANSAFTFESGKLGLTFNWMGQTPRYRSMIKSFDWDVCPLPSGPAGAPTVLKGNQLVVARNSKHPDAGWRFIRFLTDSESERELYAIIRRSYPTRIAVAESDDFLKTKQPPYNTRAFTDSIQRGRPLPINDRWSEWVQVLNSELDNLASGRERNAAKVLGRAQNKIDQVLAEPAGF